MNTGSQGRYSWLVSRRMGIGHLLEHCPQAVLGRYLVITSFDSGPLALNETERGMGWQVDGQLTYTNKLTSIETLPHDSFDEWYVFKSPVSLTGCEVFVNRGALTFDAPVLVHLDPTWDGIGARAEVERLIGTQSRFWRQLERFGAESYIAEGDFFLFASADRTLFEDLAVAFDAYT